MKKYYVFVVIMAILLGGLAFYGSANINSVEEIVEDISIEDSLKENGFIQTSENMWYYTKLEFDDDYLGDCYFVRASVNTETFEGKVLVIGKCTIYDQDRGWHPVFIGTANYILDSELNVVETISESFI